MGSRAAQQWADHIEFVGLCDINPKRAELAKQALGVSCPTFTDFDRMVTETKPELLTVTTVDAYHSEYIVKCLTGIAARRSFEEGRAVDIASLLRV